MQKNLLTNSDLATYTGKFLQITRNGTKNLPLSKLQRTDSFNVNLAKVYSINSRSVWKAFGFDFPLYSLSLKYLQGVTKAKVNTFSAMMC